jgi:PAS domain S-box-containing protein
MEEHRQTEKALRLKEGKFESVLRAAPVGIGIVIDRVIQEVNDRFCAMTGYSRDELLHRHVRFLYPTEVEYERVGREKYRQIDEVGSGTVETMLRCKDGAVIDVLLSSTLLNPNDPSGEVTFAALDITERKRAEERLTASEDRLRLAIEAAGLGTWDFDPVTGILNWSVRCKEIFGLSRDAHVDYQTFLDCLHPDDRDRMDESVQQALKHNTGNRYDFEYRVVWPDGTERWIMALARAILGDVNGERQVTRFIGTILDISERKRLEYELRRRNAEIQAVYDHAPFMLCVLDGNRELVFVNRAFATRTCTTPEKAGCQVACGVLGCLTTLDNRRGCGHGSKCDTCSLRHAILDTIETGRAHHNIEHVVSVAQPGDRTDQAWLCSTARIPMEDKPRVLLIFQDITQRRQAEEILLESEERYRSLVRSTMDAVLLGTPDGRILDANEAACRMFGRTEQELIQLERNAIVDISDPRLASALEQRSRTECFRGELMFVRKDGTKFPGEISSTIFTNRHGEPRTSSVLRDITGRKTAEQDLRAAEALFREFSENVDDIFWITTPDFGKFVFINAAYERIWQRSCQSLVEDAWSWFEAVHPEDRQYVSEVLDKNPQEGWMIQFRIILPDGSVRWIKSSAFPIKGKDETVLHMGGIAEDITEEKRMQQEAEYHRQRIIHADKLSALGEVVAGVAHEINNPNSFIMYNIPVLDQTWKLLEPIVLEHAKAHPDWSGSELSLEDLCQGMRGIIHDIRGGSDRINKIVKNLKDFARLEGSGHARPVQVNDVIEKTMMIVRAQLRKHTAKIVTELADDLPEIEGHFNKLEQVVANLLVNAAHAVKGKDDGCILISTRYAERLDAVLVTVEDNGAGIVRDDMNRIFDPFFTTRRNEGGTGLGLSVSHGLIEEHKGRMGALSRPGQGSRFTVFLPVNGKKTLELTPTILCVDDDPVFLGMLRAHFVRVDQCAQGLESPEDVMGYLAEHPEVDIVLSDLLMPNVSGWELLAMVKEKYPLLTFILHSGDPEALNSRPERIPEPDYLLEKPFTMKLLAELVSKIGRQRL